MSNSTSGNKIALIGHPFAPIGMGEHIRCVFRSLRSVGISPAIVDIYGLNKPEPEAEVELMPYVESPTRKLNIFHINGDEVDLALATLAYRSAPSSSYNVIYPAWELANYPKVWAHELERFDEVWAPSHFIKEGISAVVQRPVVHMPLACEVILSYFQGRRVFGIPENALVYLFFFDLRSYSSRKNPEAVLAAFRKLLKCRPYAECVLVLKVNGADVTPNAYEKLREEVMDLNDRVILIEKMLTDNEVKNLIRCSDCFVSLHRSEGFGRGLAEAMFLGKPVISTGYSGNMDFTSADTTMLVDYTLIPVERNKYPHWEGQFWAEPDLDQAAQHMAKVFDDPCFARELGQKASLKIRTNFGYRASGVRYSKRLNKIIALKNF